MKKTIGVIMIACALLSSCRQVYRTQNGVKTYQKPISVIYIYHESFGGRYPEYKIDLDKKQFWQYKSGNRDASKDNEGFLYVCDLDEEKIETFLILSARYGFTKWEEEYDNYYVLDGHQWGILIVFYDSTQQAISGSNKYPKTWDKMRVAFEDLTGTDLLIVSSDWID